jgi:hypothetical protein
MARLGLWLLGQRLHAHVHDASLDAIEQRRRWFDLIGLTAGQRGM